MRVAKTPQLPPYRLRRLVHHLRIRVRVLVAKVQVVQASDRYDVDVAVRHLETGQHHADPLRLESRHLRAADRLRGFGEVAEQRGFEVDPVVDLLSRHNQRMARAKRAIGEKDDALFVFPNEPGRQAAFDDLGEDRRHSEKPSLYPVTQPAVELIKASKRYGDVQALHDVSLNIDPGEVVAMLGPNGAGKTTSISLMLGLRNPSSGKAQLFGLDPKDRRARSRVGVMLQESGVPGVLRVQEIVDLFRSYYAAPLPGAEAIRMAGLEAKARSQVKDLSGGQHQRLYLARALCGNPDALFLDEPTVGMDVEGRRLFLQEIAELAARGRTVILTTHYLEEADQLARRIIVINHGRVIADASPAAIKARVAGKRVTFSTPTPPDDGLFAGLPLSSKRVEDHRVRLLTNEPENVLRELFRRGVDIHDLEIAGADLEEAFVAMTHQDIGA